MSSIYFLGGVLENYSTGLKKIFTYDLNYSLMLIYFVIIFAGLYYFEVPVYLLVFYSFGLILIPYAYQRKVKESAELKMKLLYAKTKITQRINDFERLIKESENIENRKAIEEVLESIKLDHKYN